MRFLNVALATVAIYTTSSFAAFVDIYYYPEANDCTGREEQLEINGDTCNSGNNIRSWKLKDMDGTAEGAVLDFYVDGSGCVGDLGDQYAFVNAANTSYTECHKPVPGVGSVYFYV